MIPTDKTRYKIKIKDPTPALREQPESENKVQQWSFSPCREIPLLRVVVVGALTPQLRDTLEKLVNSEKVVLFMKGTRDFPMCGFSNTVVQILKNLNVPFEVVNILENEMVRQGLKEFSSWPTFPQLYIGGEFFGGCDITLEAFQSGELQEVVERAMCS
ncbi:unnamed protein product [Brassica napus]|uniref:(rape) hypothetical protein n=1 Tax=Brassica napus TaxID=3708 RepID=A0A816UC31_BRANA|nr:unnamed protein product [Brassica napus]